MTGVFLRQTELGEKQTELLVQGVPGMARLGMLWDAISMNQFDAAERRAKAFGLDVRSLKFDHLPYDFDAVFAASSPVVVTTRSCELAQVSDSGSNSSNVFFGSNDYVQRFR